MYNNLKTQWKAQHKGTKVHCFICSIDTDDGSTRGITRTGTRKCVTGESRESLRLFLSHAFSFLDSNR